MKTEGDIVVLKKAEIKGWIVIEKSGAWSTFETKSAAINLYRTLKGATLMPFNVPYQVPMEPWEGLEQLVRETHIDTPSSKDKILDYIMKQRDSGQK